ncbi:protein kinase, partial [Streptomyces sp. WAC06614]|uniref:protein kinase n=1 Tax=Streptomyces sp. WAC06614 TaxID=2487416 RepID=UPI0034D97C22
MGDTALGGGDVDDYAGRILAGRYRLPVPPTDAYELVETRAFDTRTGQEVLVRQVPLPEVLDAELLDGAGTPAADVREAAELPAVRRAIEAAQAAARIPDHPRLDQVFDVFAEGASLWIVGELVPARPLAALIAERPLSPYRAAEVAADVLTALRVLHAHGWTHRNITVRTVLVCDDGRVVLTGLASGAAEEALCGYDPVPLSDPWTLSPGPAPEAPAPRPDGTPLRGAGAPPRAGGPEPAPREWWRPAPAGTDTALPGRAGQGPHPPENQGRGPGPRPPENQGRGPGPRPPEDQDRDQGPGGSPLPDGPVPDPWAEESVLPPPRPAPRQDEAGYAPLVAPGYATVPLPRGAGGPVYRDHVVPRQDGDGRPDLTAAARAGAIAAYRAGARAAAQESTEPHRASVEPGPREAPPTHPAPPALSAGATAPRGAAELQQRGDGERGAEATEAGPSARPAGPRDQREAGRRGDEATEAAQPARPAGSTVPQGYEFPYGTPRRPALPTPRPDRAVPSLPAQLALPQGFQQARPGPDPDRPDDVGAAPGAAAADD